MTLAVTNLLFMPVYVLLPVYTRDRLGEAPAWYGLLLASASAGSLLGLASLAVSRPGSPSARPIVVVGIASGVGDVIWGTLLQRRVPDQLRGRISSLDFFVSLALLPASMVLAGPAGDAFGLTAVFIAAGVIPAVLGPLALIAGRLRADELSHPLD